MELPIHEASILVERGDADYIDCQIVETAMVTNTAPRRRPGRPKKNTPKATG